MWLDAFNKMRKQSGMSLDELSEKSGVPKGTLSKITSGITKAPTLETIRSLVYTMGYTLNDLDENLVEPKKSPVPAEASTEEISLDESNSLLVALGYIKPGEQISDDDLAFLGHVIGLLNAWFDKGH